MLGRQSTSRRILYLPFDKDYAQRNTSFELKFEVELIMIDYNTTLRDPASEN